jgi:hypothetical protein
MPQPVSYNTGAPVSGSIQENNIAYVVDGQNRDYRGGFGGLSWMSELPAANNVVFIGNSTSLGRGPANIPLFYPSFNNSEANIIYAVNKLPGSPGNFTTTSSAYNWATTNNYFINNSDNPIPRIDADGLVLCIDANQPTSYPQTGTSVYDLSGRNNNGTLVNGPTWNSNGWIVFDSTDDYIDTALATNALFSSNDPFSISITLKPTETITSNSGLVCNQRYQSEGSPGGFGLVTYNTNQVAINLTKNDGTGTVSYQSLAPTTLNINSWQNIIYTYDPVTGTVNGYKNGTLTNSNTSATYKWTPEARTTWIAINTQGGWGDFFSSEISNISIYRKTLSTPEVKQNYFQGNIVTSSLSYLWDANNLVSYGKTGTNVYNLTGSISGSLTNGTGYNYSNGGSWTFDGVDDYILLENSLTSITPGNGNWTLSAWVKGPWNSSTLYPIVGNTSGGPVASGFAIYNNQIFYQNYDGSWQPHYGNTTLNSNTWYHLTWVNYDGGSPSLGTMKMYVNGVADSSTFNSYTTNGGPVNAIGRGYNGIYSGNIASVQWNIGTSFTDQQVAQQYEATKDKFLGQNIVTQGLVINLDAANKDSYPGTGTTWYDLSGNSINGTLTNGPTFLPNTDGGVINFDGVDDYTIITPPTTYSEYTIQFFCKWISSVGFSERLFGSDAFGTYTIFNPFNVGFHYNPLGGSPPSVTLASGVNVGFGNWCNVAVTVSTASSNVVIYVNGIARNSWNVLPSANLSANIFLGAQNTSLYSNCQFGNFQIYNRALSATEIAQNYNAQKTRFGL